MNQLNFSMPQGWPASTETWQWLQHMSNTAQLAALLGGKNYILEGCIEASGNVGNGLMVINGEILPFEGGPLQPTLIVVDTPTKRAFFGGAVNDYYHERKVVFGTGIGQITYGTLLRNIADNGLLARMERIEGLLARTEKLEKMLRPLMGYSAGGTTVYGSWLFWGRPAAEIPPGWEPVPDAEWKGRVPVVYDAAQAEFNVVGKLGGEKTTVLTKEQLPRKNILGFTDQTVVNAGFYGMAKKSSAGQNVTVGSLDATGSGEEMDVVNVYPFPNLGNGEGHNNIQPYKVVLFIRFIG